MRVKYDDLSGSTTRYVLASSTSLDYTYHSMAYTGNVVSVDSELSESIYSKVRQYYMLTDEKGGNYFQDLYDGTIIGYFREQVMKRHEGQIKIDVIECKAGAKLGELLRKAQRLLRLTTGGVGVQLNGESFCACAMRIQ